MRNGIETPPAPQTDQSQSSLQASTNQLCELCREYPMTSLMVGLGVGVGAGLLIGGAIGGGMRSRSEQSYMDKINRRVSEALSDVIPKSWT